MTLEIRLLEEKLLSHGRFKLTMTKAEVVEADGSRRVLNHEIYHYEPAAAILLYDPERGVVLLVRQVRLGGFVGGALQPMIEACAGMLDGDEPEAGIVRETMEETGIAVRAARHVFDAFMSPGAITERISCFVASYNLADRVGAGGGSDADERIEIIEPTLGEALQMIENGEICDAKTIALLYYARIHDLLSV
jgi:nudix-type nucleoside diphosphatase (YffH/AdpP family)